MHDIPEKAVKAADIIQAITDLRLAILQDDDEGLAEHAEPMIKAKDLIAKLSASPFLPVQGAVKKLEWWAAESGDVIADSIVGRYRLGKVTANTNFRLETPSGLIPKPAPDYYWPEDEAKAAAQADFEARILSALEPSATDMGNPITLTYTNYRGETSERAITPIRPWYGTTEWHPEPQWLLKAYDHEKDAERDFAFKDFGSPEPSAARDLALDGAYTRLSKFASSAATGIDIVGEILMVYDAAPGHPQWQRVVIRELAEDIKIVLRALSSPDHADASKVEGDGWKPIESAPKDGGFLAANSTEVWAAWHYDSPNWHARYGSRGATHWRPLPSAPSQEATVMASELNPCPFCQYKAHEWIQGNKKMACCDNMDCPCRAIVCTVEQWNTRPAPAATDTGLETVGYVTTMPTGAEGFQRKPLVPGHGQFGYKQDAVVTRSQAEELLAAERAKAAEKERLRFEGDLDKWMKIIGAGITGYQPEAYTLMDFACEELVKLRADNAALTARVEELEANLLDAADVEPGEHQEILDALEAHNSGEEQ